MLLDLFILQYMEKDYIFLESLFSEEYQDAKVTVCNQYSYEIMSFLKLQMFILAQKLWVKLLF